jgi:methylated-DNA-[protein]-cysteine S-methyltransferase
MATFLKHRLALPKIVGDDNGIAIISVQDEEASELIPEVLQECVMQLGLFRRKEMILVSAQSRGTDFQQKWKALLEILWKTRTYLEQSSIRGCQSNGAVASANGKNPLWIVVPCHRVIGTDGSLTGCRRFMA